MNQPAVLVERYLQVHGQSAHDKWAGYRKLLKPDHEANMKKLGCFESWDGAVGRQQPLKAVIGNLPRLIAYVATKMEQIQLEPRRPGKPRSRRRFISCT